MVTGHRVILDKLTEELPRVTLFMGPSSVGKTTLAFEVVRAHGVQHSDLMRFRELTIDNARAIARAAYQAPSVSPFRVAMVDIDGASEAALNVLLKPLEDAPESTRFILIASGPIPETVQSRSTLAIFPLLADREVEEILLGKNFAPSEAKRLAALSGGQVETALKWVRGSEAQVQVLAALRALSVKDADALDGLAGKWTDEHTELLAQLCRESLTKRWRVFQAAEVEGMNPSTFLGILVALRANVRPRLAVRAGLMSVLKENRG